MCDGVLSVGVHVLVYMSGYVCLCGSSVSPNYRKL